LELGQKEIRQGQTKAMEVIAKMMTMIIDNSTFEIDYLAIVNPIDLQDVEEVSPNKPYVIAIAAYMGNTRLIDNLINFPS
jgi:pantothenate synthetase